MPDDILEAAQKAIKDTQSPAADPSAKLPTEPAPDPLVPPTSPAVQTPETVTVPNYQEPHAMQSVSQEPSPEASALVSSLLSSPPPPPPVDPVPVAPASPSIPPVGPTPPPAPKKTGGKGLLMAVLALFLLAIPVSVYFLSQRQSSVADTRSMAEVYENRFHFDSNCTCQPGPAPENDPMGFGTFLSLGECTAEQPVCFQNRDSQCKQQGGSCVPFGWTCSVNQPTLQGCTNGYKCGRNCQDSGIISPTPNPFQCDTDPNSPIPSCQTGINDCHCQGGDPCTGTRCEPDIRTSCLNQGRAWCVNELGYAMTCCVAGYTCGPNGAKGCYPPGGGPTHTPNPPSPTPDFAGVCRNLKIYKNGIQVDPSSLRAGDQAQLAVTGTDSPTQARFRINGGPWNVSTTKNSLDEFVYNFPVPSGITDFVIEAEVFANGEWK